MVIHTKNKHNFQSLEKNREKSVLLKHKLTDHPHENVKYKMEITKKFRDSLTRQANEADPPTRYLTASPNSTTLPWQGWLLKKENGKKCNMWWSKTPISIVTIQETILKVIRIRFLIGTELTVQDSLDDQFFRL